LRSSRWRRAEKVTAAQLNVLVDHASPYFRKGALGLMEVTP
jgi:hypothetical protein